MEQIHTILFPIDFTDESRQGLRRAADLAEQLGATLLLVHVPKRPVMWGGADAALVFPVPPSWRPDDQELGLRIQALVDETVPSTIPVRWRIAAGAVSRTLAAVAEEEGADLIVVPTHPHRRWRETLFGASPEKIVHYASRPVRTVMV